MTMNYMDYTDDRGMYMFTDKKARVDALFVSGGGCFRHLIFNYNKNTKTTC
jgi:hypothetical protein